MAQCHRFQAHMSQIGPKDALGVGSPSLWKAGMAIHWEKRVVEVVSLGVTNQ